MDRMDRIPELPIFPVTTPDGPRPRNAMAPQGWVKPSSGVACIDTETTGLGEQSRIIEIAVVLLDPHLNVEHRWSTLVDPQLDYIGAYRVHLITRAMLHNQPSFADVETHLADMLADRVVIAHHLAFDATTLNRAWERCEAPTRITDGVCTLEWARNLFARPWRNQLAQLAQRLDVPRGETHRAVGDVDTLTRVLPAMVRTQTRCNHTAVTSWPIDGVARARTLVAA